MNALILHLQLLHALVVPTSGPVGQIHWVEAEAFEGSFENLRQEPMPGASEGSVLDPRFATSARNWVSYQVELPHPIEEALLILRYAGQWEGSCRILIEIDQVLPTEQPSLELTPTTGDGRRPQDYACAATTIGHLPAGVRHVRLMPIDALRAPRAPEEDSGETPRSLQDGPTDSGPSQTVPTILLDGFFITPAAADVPTDIWSFQQLWHQAVSLPGKRHPEAVAPDNFVVQPIDPWQAIPRALEWYPLRPPEHPVLRLEGNVNEYLSGAALVTRVGGQDTARIEIEGESIRRRCSLKVAGLYLSRWYGPVFDPLFCEEDIETAGDLSRAVLNWSGILGWPMLRFAPSQTHLVWLTFDARNASPGSHRGHLVLNLPGGRKQRIPLLVEIRPIVLPRDNPLLSYAFTPCPSDQREIDDMISHGINVFRSNPYEEGGTKVPEGHRWALKHGAKFILYNYRAAWGLKPLETDKQREDARECVRDIIASARSAGIEGDQWAAQMSDEPNSKHVPIIKEYARLAREVSPSIRLWLDPGWSGHEPGSLAESHGLDTFFRPLQDDIDVWCPFVGHLWRDDQPVYDFLRSTGDELWFYKNASIWSKKPDAGFGWYRKVSWIAFQYQTRAAGMWHLAYFIGDPWDEFDRRYPDGAFTYRGAGEHLITSRVYESYRQGIQEYKRLWWLDRLLSAAESDEARGVAAHASEQRDELDHWVRSATRANTADAMTRIVRGVDDAIMSWQDRLHMRGEAYSSPRWDRAFNR